MAALAFDPASDFLETARALVATFIEDLAAHGVIVGEAPPIERGEGMLCAYNLRDGRIQLAFPDPGDPLGRVKALFLRALMGCENDEELNEFIALFLPRLLAHELAHCIRHRLSLFGEDLWLEEQIANTVASALTAHRYPPDRRKRLSFLLRRAADGLAEQLDSGSAAVDTYHDPLAAFVVNGVLGVDVAASLESVAHLFETDPATMLGDSGFAGATEGKRLLNRAELISHFNADYTSNLIRYMHYQTTWSVLDLESRQRYYLNEVAAKFFGHAQSTLAPDMDGPAASLGETRALFCVSTSTGADETARRFFYKRYREAMISLVTRDMARTGGSIHQNEEWATRARSLLETWAEGQPDPLRFLSATLPPPLRALLPQNLQTARISVDLKTELPRANDRRLWDALAQDASDDPSARETWRLLRALDRIEIFRSISSDLLLELAGLSIDVHFSPGETIIWQGEVSRDMFLIVEGDLDVLETGGVDGERRLAQLTNNDAFGEMGFISGEPRSAMVRAKTEARCLVIKGADLDRLARRNAELPIAMGRLLARRLAAVNRASGAPHTETPS